MRPVVRGPWPQNVAGEEIQFQDYAKARGELINRLGEYCSYCEMELDSSLAVEHIQPKRPDWADNDLVERKFNWNNFVLACTNCNSTKGTIDVDLASYYWPHLDNTFHALAYSEAGVVSPAAFLNEDQREKADNIIKLVGLDKQPGNNPAASDRRWRNRLETWGIATKALSDLAELNHDAMRNIIVELAEAKGYWSIWMTVFQDDPDMLRRFIAALPGTASDCFNDDGEAVARPTGQI